jgi:RNA polymerase sigma-70 factor (ECF subfamily)
LLTIARHATIDALRSAARRPTTIPLDQEGHEPDVADLITAEHALDSLEPDRRLALYLTQLLGLSYEEAAAVCGVPVGTIRSRVARGREDLAVRLDQRRRA